MVDVDSAQVDALLAYLHVAVYRQLLSA